MPSLLLIDDETSIHYSFRRVFEREGIEVLTAGDAAEGLAQARARGPDVVVLDLQLPDRSGLEVFGDLQKLIRRPPVIFITAHGTSDTALTAMKDGAFDYLVKPVDLDDLSQILRRAFEAARLQPQSPPAEGPRDRIVGRSPVIQEMCKAVGRVAAQDVNVLIRGESGTGKELVARALFLHGRRADRPFLAINCAAIPEPLLESELFGHEPGAFTGAVRRHQGKFERCDGGTLFLDEIGDMSPALQAKMLRVLQEQRFERLGGTETIETSVRILAATNQNLERLVEEGRFRKDLYYRLKGVTITVPPLRDRLDDIEELAAYFLSLYNHQLNLDVRSFSPDALELLRDYLWPGNVRELQSVVKQAMVQVSGHVVTPEFLPDDVLAGGKWPGQDEEGDPPDLRQLIEALLESGADNLHDRVIEAVERALLPRVLRRTGGNQARASGLLGLSRATLRAKLRALGLSVDKVVSGEVPAAAPSLTEQTTAP